MKKLSIRFLFVVFLLIIMFVSFDCKKNDNNPISTESPASENTWSQTSFPALRVNSITTNAVGYIFVGTDSNGIYRSTDVGATWTQINNGLTENHINVVCTAITSGDLYAGTGGAGIFHSTDQGITWKDIDPFSSSNADVYSIAVNGKGDIFAATNLGMVLRTTNGGSLWTALTISTSISTIYSLAIDTAGTIFAGTSSSIAISTNNGNSWKRPRQVVQDKM